MLFTPFPWLGARDSLRVFSTLSGPPKRSAAREWLFALFTGAGKIATCIFLICFLWVAFSSQVGCSGREGLVNDPAAALVARPSSKVTQCHFFNILTAYDC